MDLKNYKVPEGKVLVLRTSDKDRKSHGRFQWPESGYVSCPDWKPTKECGNGLHGALKGEGDGLLFKWNHDAVWQVLEVDELTIIDLQGKVKFPDCHVVLSGSRKDATEFIASVYPMSKCIGLAITAGYNGQATAGYNGQATAGDNGQAAAGENGQATAGENGIIIIQFYDGVRYRIVAGYIGEDGLKPNTPYKLNYNHKFKEVI